MAATPSRASCVPTGDCSRSAAASTCGSRTMRRRPAPALAAGAVSGACGRLAAAGWSAQAPVLTGGIGAASAARANVGANAASIPACHDAAAGSVPAAAVLPASTSAASSSEGTSACPRAWLSRGGSLLSTCRAVAHTSALSGSSSRRCAGGVASCHLRRLPCVRAAERCQAYSAVSHSGASSTRTRRKCATLASSGASSGALGAACGEGAAFPNDTPCTPSCGSSERYAAIGT